MKSPDDVIEILKRKFKNKHREWLKETVSENNGDCSDCENSWSLEINLGIPTEQEALKHPEGVRSWISVWNKWQNSNKTNNNAESKGNYSPASSTLIWSERRWRSLGTQSVPEKLTITSAKDAAAWIGEDARWLRAAERYKLLVKRWSSLIDVLPRHFNILADYNDGDFNNLCEILSWICANPSSNLYIRQVPVAGIDSKWLEARKGLVAELIAAIKSCTSERCMSSCDISNINETKTGQENHSRDFYKICGFKPLPQFIRIRILDSKLRKMFGGLGDISAPLDEIASLDFTLPLIVFIVENIQTALAFEDMENSIVLFGLGYGVDVLGKLPWLRQARCIYWGDIDTHGFSILNRARSYLLKMESILMDKAALLSHKQLWVTEKEQAASVQLLNLTADEQELYQALKSNAFGQNVRLEQERIRWDYAWDVLRTIDG